MAKPLRILHAVEFYAPSVGGAQEVVRQLSQRLAERGHDVTVATTALAARRSTWIDGVRVVGFHVRGNAARGIQGDVDGYRRLVAEGGFDVVMTYAAQQWTTDALLELIPSLPAPVVLAPCGFSGLRDPAFGEYFASLPRYLAAFAALVFHSEDYQDIEFARSHDLAGLHVIPNGADEREFAQLPPRGRFRAAAGVSAEARLLLTVGAHTGLKGHAQSMAVLGSSKQMRRGALAIVGNRPTGPGCARLCHARAVGMRMRHPGRRVVLADPPRPQVIAAYTDADLFVFCSMVECSPLVLFECLAAGLPFVAADAGNAAEIARWSGGGVVVPSRRRPDGLVEPDVPRISDKLDELLADDGRRAAMAAAGRRAWRDHFTWAAVADRYEALYQELAR